MLFRLNERFEVDKPVFISDSIRYVSTFLATVLEIISQNSSRY